jgi:anti-sigma regulatory factor (Ser/Thr protein kinase)
MQKIVCPAKIEYLEKLIRLVSRCAEGLGMSGKRLYQVQLALEEALVNIINHAYPEEAGEIEIQCHNEKDGALVVTVQDSGIPFDISALPAPDVSASIEEREIGGLGVFLMREMADKIQYRRDGERNILTLTLRP